MAIDHKFSNTSAVSILELFQTNIQFIVPKFQRNYSWKPDKVEVMWNDILENFMQYKNEPGNMVDSQYLLGPVVLVKGKKQSEFQIIDGQQRLSTLTMLFCAARDIILELHESDDIHVQPAGIDRINNLIRNTHMGKHTTWKLVLNDTDKDLFEEIQEYEEGDRPQIERIRKLNAKTPSEKLIKNCYVFLHNNLQKLLSTNFNANKISEDISKEDLKIKQKDNLGMLNYFLDYIQQYNYIVKIMVSDDSTAFQIFETLNERGQSLSKSNLIKNHVINQIRDEEQQRDLSKKWNEIFDVVIGSNQPDDEFLIESFRSRKPKYDEYSISNKNLYKIIKKQIKDAQTCKQYIKGIKEDAYFLSQLNDPYMGPYVDTDTKDDVLAIKILKAKSIRVPILAAYRKWGINNDYKKIVQLLVKFFFKFRTVRQQHPGEVEKITLNVTEWILNGKPISEIIKEIKNHDDHDDFLYNFKRFMSKPAKDASKYILQQITLYLGDNGSDVRPIDGLTLEHVLPHKHKEHWKPTTFFESDDVEEKLDEYVPRLGNMTLLKDENNSRIANKSFPEKIEIYKKSRLKINQETVANHDKWTAKIVREREDRFQDYADKIWNLDAY